MDKSFFLSSDAFIEENKLWILTKDTDALCRYSIDNGTLEKVFIVPTCSGTEYGHLVLKNRGDYIFLLPYNDDYLYCFDKTSEKFQELQMIENGKNILQAQNCKIMCIFKGIITVVLNETKEIVFFDMNSMNKVILSNHIEKMKELGIDVDGYVFSDCYLEDENLLYIPIYMSDFVMIIDVVSQKYKFIRLHFDNKSIRVRTIGRGLRKNQFLFTTVDNERIIWDIKDGIGNVKKIDNTNKIGRYVRTFCLNGAYYYIPTHERKLYVEKNGEIRELHFLYPNNELYSEYEYTQYEAIFSYNEYVFIQARSNGIFFKINSTDDSVQEVCVYKNIEDGALISKKAFEVRGIPRVIEESDNFDIAGFLNLI